MHFQLDTYFLLSGGPVLVGDILKYTIQLEFSATNNIAEYNGLVTCLRLAKDVSIWWLLIRGDSQLVAKEVQKEYDCNNEKIVEYLAEVRRMEKFFDGFEVWYVPWLDNHDVDVNHLVWIASSRAPTLPDVIIKRLYKPSVKHAEPAHEIIGQDLMVIDKVEQEPVYDWMHLIKMFIENQPLSDDNVEVECIARKSKQYHLIDDILFRWGVNDMMMKCISIEEGILLLKDIHNGICGSHSSWHSIIDKSLRHGFYWPSILGSSIFIEHIINPVQH
jgi:hypothetical protein